MPAGVFGDIARAIGPEFDVPDSFEGRRACSSRI